MANRHFETDKNSALPHSGHIFKTAYDVAMETISAYPPSKHALPHCKLVLSCCANFPCIDIPIPESYQHNSNAGPTICFRKYHLILRCTMHDIFPFN